MVFGKGGWAGSNATLKVTSTHPAHGGTASFSEFVDGWTIGGGVEYAAWNSVIIGIEYDYVALSLNSGGSCPLCDAGLTIDSPVGRHRHRHDVGGDAARTTSGPIKC